MPCPGSGRTGHASDVAAARVTRVTSDDFWYGDPQWMPDGKSLIVHANRTADRESVRFSINKNYDLWQINLADGKFFAARHLGDEKLDEARTGDDGGAEAAREAGAVLAATLDQLEQLGLGELDAADHQVVGLVQGHEV